MSDQLSLFGPEPASPVSGAAPVPCAADPDASARAFAVDPGENVVLEASAGTGKTSVLVGRYVGLLQHGVDPANILAITFTRKAAAEMRERIVRELRERAGRGEIPPPRWSELRDRLPDVAISTIDAFCLSLLREFPLEADLDPGFEMADETEVPRLAERALDGALRVLSAQARHDEDVALVLAQLGFGRTRQGLALLLERRLVAAGALDRFLARGPASLTAAVACRRAAAALHDALRAVPGGLAGFLADGPSAHPRYEFFQRAVTFMADVGGATPAAIRAGLERVAPHFLTRDGRPRTGGSIQPYRSDHYPDAAAARRHRAAVFHLAPHVERVMTAFGRDLNVVLARGVRRMFAVALSHYRRALEERSVLDFSDVLQRALELLRRMDEFSRSRYRLEARYHHVLVDEFQDTSRAQWELVSLLVHAWGEGAGLPMQPTIFVVGDRKQSIYRFRDADVGVLQQAARHIQGLRPGSDPRRAISRSFRAVPELLAFVNEVFSEIASAGTGRPDHFTYGESDRFPLDVAPDPGRGPVLGLAVADTVEGTAAAVADEVQRLLRDGHVRDPRTGVPRAARPGDVAVLFRSRASHREFEQALQARGIPTYVYKGLGFFDADETKDLVALLRYLARPSSDLRAAAYLRSRIVRLSDAALAALSPRFADALAAPTEPAAMARLEDEDRRVLARARAVLPSWLAQVDRIPPADLLDRILSETAYAFELRGPRRRQAWENLKKMRGLIRRVQNRGYATLPRIAEHIDALSAGDESNAALEATNAVNLMTVHAAKGLEFPIVFVVNLARGASGPPPPVRLIVDGSDGEPAVSIGPFASDEDGAERDREKHETRRLLYVALTRARDRLYLSSVLDEGELVCGRGSLAEILPESLKALLPRALTAFTECDVLGWSGASGRTYEWRICRAAGDRDDEPRRDTDEAAVVDRLEPLTSAGPRRVGVRDRIGHPGAPPGRGTGGTGARLAGVLVHRLFQCAHRNPGHQAEAESVLRLLRPGEAADVADANGLVSEVLQTWNRMRGSPEIAALLEQGFCSFEVPFSTLIRGVEGPVVLRGVIDVIVRRPDGGLVVVELKTGSPRPGDEEQLAAYVQAVRALNPGVEVEGKLLYP